MMVIFATLLNWNKEFQGKVEDWKRKVKGFGGEEELGAGRGRAKRGEELQSLEDCSTC